MFSWRHIINRHHYLSGQPDYPPYRNGLPGTDKTACARWLAEHPEVPLIVKRDSDLISMWVGGTEENIAAALRQAETEGGILLIDEKVNNKSGGFMGFFWQPEGFKKNHRAHLQLEEEELCFKMAGPKALSKEEEKNLSKDEKDALIKERNASISKSQNTLKWKWHNLIENKCEGVIKPTPMRRGEKMTVAAELPPGIGSPASAPPAPAMLLADRCTGVIETTDCKQPVTAPGFTCT